MAAAATALGLLDGRSVSLLPDQRFVDVRNDAASGDGGLDQGVQLFVTTNGKLQVAGGDSLHLQVLGRIASQLQNLEHE